MNEAADPIMLAALQHRSYCPPQCVLVLLEQAFDENVNTMRGNAAHERMDDPGFETFEGVRPHLGAGEAWQGEIQQFSPGKTLWIATPLVRLAMTGH